MFLKAGYMWRNAVVIMVAKVKQMKTDNKTLFRCMTSTPRLRFSPNNENY